MFLIPWQRKVTYSLCRQVLPEEEASFTLQLYRDTAAAIPQGSSTKDGSILEVMRTSKPGLKMSWEKDRSLYSKLHLL